MSKIPSQISSQISQAVNQAAEQADAAEATTSQTTGAAIPGNDGDVVPPVPNLEGFGEAVVGGVADVIADDVEETKSMAESDASKVANAANGATQIAQQAWEAGSKVSRDEVEFPGSNVGVVGEHIGQQVGISGTKVTDLDDAYKSGEEQSNDAWSEANNAASGGSDDVNDIVNAVNEAKNMIRETKEEAEDRKEKAQEKIEDMRDDGEAFWE